MTLAPSKLLGPRLTLPPDDGWVPYELEDVCYVEGCPNPPERGSHHIEPRSRTGGPRDFVTIDGVVVANRVRLCTPMHRAVTGGVGGHKARIIWATRIGRWVYLRRRRDDSWEFVAQLREVKWR